MSVGYISHVYLGNSPVTMFGKWRLPPKWLKRWLDRTLICHIQIGQLDFLVVIAECLPLFRRFVSLTKLLPVWRRETPLVLPSSDKLTVASCFFPQPNPAHGSLLPLLEGCWLLWLRSGRPETTQIGGFPNATVIIQSWTLRNPATCFSSNTLGVGNRTADRQFSGWQLLLRSRNSPT